MRVFLAATSLHPHFGGPAFSVSQLATALAEAGIGVGLWASDQSASHTPLLTARPFVERLTGSFREAIVRFGIPDILHDNGIWLPHHHQLANLAARRNLVRLVSIRGMLEPWALNHRRWKKKVAWMLYQRRDLQRATLHHATADIEARAIERLDLGVPVGVIPNGVNVPNVASRGPKPPGTRNALFLGRIHPVKGLSQLIEAWGEVRPRGWRLLIAGPDEISYRAELMKKISTTSVSENVKFLGPLDGKAKENAFVSADLFVSPSLSESFGMAIGEALAHGLPVLTTTRTPWQSVVRQQCGWTVAPTVEGIAAGLREATSLDETTLVSMGQRGTEWVRTNFAWPNIAKQFIATYEDLLGRRNAA